MNFRFLSCIFVLLFSLPSFAEIDAFDGILYSGTVNYDFTFEMKFEDIGLLPPSDSEVETAVNSAPHGYGYEELMKKIAQLHVGLLGYDIRAFRKGVRTNVFGNVAYVTYDVKIEASVLSAFETPITSKRVTSAKIYLIKKDSVIDTNLGLNFISFNFDNIATPVVLSDRVMEKVKNIVLTDKGFFPKYSMVVNLFGPEDVHIGKISFDDSQLKSSLSLTNGTLFLRACGNLLKNL